MRASYRPVIAGAAAIGLLAGSVSCGDVVRQGRAPVIVVVDSVAGRLGRRARKHGRFSAVRRPDARRPAVDGETLRAGHLQRRGTGDDATSSPRTPGPDQQPGSDALECGDHQPLSHHVHQGRWAEHSRRGCAISRRRRGDRHAVRRRRPSCRSRSFVISRSSNNPCDRWRASADDCSFRPSQKSRFMARTRWATTCRRRPRSTSASAITRIPD